MLIDPFVKETIYRAIREDMGNGDITTESLVLPGIRGEAIIVAKSYGVLAGTAVFQAVFLALDNSAVFKDFPGDGATVKKGDLLGRVSASIESLLSGERTALNFLQHLSGIAGRARHWQGIIEDFNADLVDTRKTTPGLRQLEKYAVRVGGGLNHRLDLSGGVLIKENHIRAAGSIETAVRLARKIAPITAKIEVEVTGLGELQEALKAGADIIMLDNMDIKTIEEAVRINGGRALLEVSGNVKEERLREIAATGVDFISSGALTYGVPFLDISMLITEVAT